MKDTVLFEGSIVEVEYQELAPAIFVYKNIFPKEMRIIETIEEALSLPNTPFQWDNSSAIGDESVIKIDHANWEPRTEYSAAVLDLHDLIIQKVKQCIEHYRPLNNLRPIEYIDGITVAKYGAGNYFEVHADDGDYYRCILSTVGYPNDEYKGGDLTFPNFNLTYKPEAGDLVLFPSAYPYAHLTEPITDEGIKYSLVMMADWSEFTFKKDSAILYDTEVLLQEDYGIYGLNNPWWKNWKKEQ